MDKRGFLFAVFVLLFLGAVACTETVAPDFEPNGDQGDGIADGDEADGDTTDGDEADGEPTDGDEADGDTTDSDEPPPDGDAPMEGYCRSDADCREGIEFCYKLSPHQDDFGIGYGLGRCEEYCFNDGNVCPKDQTCDSHRERANYGKCYHDISILEACSSDEDCEQQVAPNYYCAKLILATTGYCVEKCGPDNPCRGGLVCCDNGRCQIVCDGESCSRDCPTGHRCEPSYDACFLNCPPCDVNTVCDSMTAPDCYPGLCVNAVFCGFGLPHCCGGYRCTALMPGILGFCI